jgi:hypothetical protein
MNIGEAFKLEKAALVIVRRVDPILTDSCKQTFYYSYQPDLTHGHAQCVRSADRRASPDSPDLCKFSRPLIHCEKYFTFSTFG